MKKTCRRGQAPYNLLLDGGNGSGLRSGSHNLLLLLLLAGHEGGGGKSENSDGLHNFLVYVNFGFQSPPTRGRMAVGTVYRFFFRRQA